MPPLHHLIKPSQAAALLSEFMALSPGSSLGLHRADGVLFASAGDPHALPAGLPQAAEAPARQPLFTGGELVAYLSASSQAAHLLGPLLHCFAILFQQAVEKRAIARETLDRYREINLLYNTAETIGACLDPDEIPALVLQESARVISADAGLVLLRAAEGAGALELSARWPAFYPPDGPPSASLEGSFSPVDDLLEAGRGLVERVIETGRPDILSAGLFISLLCAPFKARERALGAVLLGRAAPASAAFTAGDEKLLMALAGQAGISIEKAWMHRQELQRQRLEQELVIGRRIQRSLLPESVPSLPGWEFSAYYQSAREVGGDFYDFFEGEDGQLGLFIADVTGKGVPAALMMAFNRAMLRTLLRAGPQYANRPADTLQRLNSLLLSDSRTGLLLTALYASLDPASGRLAYANAGHERPLWLHQASGVCQELISAGPLLGAFQRVTIDESQVKLEPGDLLVFFTDGVTEARSPEGAVFGEERLLETVQTCRGLGAEETARVILQAVQSFSAHTAQADDYTTVVIKRVL